MDRLEFLRLLPAALLVATGCHGSQGAQHVNLPAPSERSEIGPGDTFTLEIMGEKDLPKDYMVAADGTVDIPYVHTVAVAGLEPSEVARMVRQRLIEEKILNDPTVVVQVREYRSRRVNVLGQIAKPGSFPFTPTMTLIQAISMAGGLTTLADSDRVTLTRKAEKGAYTAVVSVGIIMEGRSPDIPLQSGDQIFVHERLF
jgi:protein involved in polysaccharide export with SLBB domain